MLPEFNFVSDERLLAINDEEIKTAVMNGNRPPLDVIAEPAGWLSSLRRRIVRRNHRTLTANNLLLSITQWIARCWDKLPNKRPSFRGKYNHHCLSTICLLLYHVGYSIAVHVMSITPLYHCIPANTTIVFLYQCYPKVEIPSNSSRKSE